jgi:hypothetical protein
MDLLTFSHPQTGEHLFFGIRGGNKKIIICLSGFVAVLFVV